MDLLRKWALPRRNFLVLYRAVVSCTPIFFNRAIKYSFPLYYTINFWKNQVKKFQDRCREGGDDLTLQKILVWQARRRTFLIFYTDQPKVLRRGTTLPAKLHIFRSLLTSYIKSPFNPLPLTVQPQSTFVGKTDKSSF